MPATIYLIRHGEKLEDENGDDIDGLSEVGEQRAQGLPDVFGKDSSYNINYILVPHYKKDGSRKRAFDTVTPLAKVLGLDIDHSIDRDDPKAVAKKIKKWNGSGNILVCWEHKVLEETMEELGVDGKYVYPGDRFDVIWTVKPPYTSLYSQTSEGVVGLDVDNTAI